MTKTTTSTPATEGRRLYDEAREEFRRDWQTAQETAEGGDPDSAADAFFDALEDWEQMPESESVRSALYEEIVGGLA